MIDVSFDGAALALDDVTIAEGLVGTLELRISSVTGDEDGVVLRAVVRRWTEVDGRIVAGVEFSVLREQERTLLHLLVGLRTLD